MTTREVATAFDEISAVYDETRDPLPPSTVERLADALRSRGVASILEVGVGTGRVARPLVDRGFEVIGLDASKGMLAKARAKGLPRLVRGTAYRLPFRDGAADAVLFVHVLHIFEEPARALEEARRVGRLGACALVRPRRDPTAGAAFRRESGEILREELAKLGYETPTWTSPMVRERDFLERTPPDSLETVGDREVTVTLRDRLDRLARRGHRHLLRVPPETLRRAVEAAQARVGDRSVTFRSVEALATWRARSGPSSN
jgi:ubiquinone/menaquinone biosynthesis C-methylase UbiE